MLSIGRPRFDDGKIKPLPSSRARASSRAAIGRGGNGTRCATRASSRHAVGGDGPGSLVRVDLAPHGLANLAAPSGGQDRELDGQPDGGAECGAAQRLDERRDPAPGQRGVVALGRAVLRWQGHIEGGGRVIATEAVGHDPPQHQIDARAHALRRHGLRAPERGEHGQNFRRADGIDRALAQTREYMVAERLAPLALVLAAIRPRGTADL